MNETTSIETLADTIEHMADADKEAQPITIVQDGTDRETPPITIPAPQKPPACGLCKRVFNFGDYVCVTTFSATNGTATNGTDSNGAEAKKGILCKKCYSSGKDRAEARVLLFTNGQVSSVNRDRAWKRQKKLQRVAKRQGNV